MPETLSPEVEKLVQQHVDGRRFTTANDVIMVAMRLFNEFQSRYQDELSAAIQRGFDQIDRSEGICPRGTVSQQHQTNGKPDEGIRLDDSQSTVHR